MIVFAERENDEEKKTFTKAVEEHVMGVILRQNLVVRQNHLFVEKYIIVICKAQNRIAINNG